jgi:serpin B
MNNYRQKIFVLFICLLLSLAFYAPPSAANPAPSATLIAGFNQFSFNLYQQSATKQTNTVMSPYLLASGFGLLASGAKGNTLTEILTAIQTPQQILPQLPQDIAELNDALLQSNNDHSKFAWIFHYSALLRRLFHQPQLLIANAFWLDNSIKYQPALQRLRTLDTLELQRINLQAPNAADIINHWVSDKTDGLIPTLVAPPLTSPLLFTNAIYFKGFWQASFRSADTKSQAFTLPNNTVITVPTMIQTHDFAYSETNDWQMVQLPYANSSLALAILLPHDLARLKSCDYSTFTQLLKTANTTSIQIELPKFTVTSNFIMNQALQHLGIKTAFNQQADFSSLLSKSAWIDQVIHKAVIQVDEQGTTAAAATAIVTFGGTPAPPVLFKVDRPFLFILFDRKTGLILFIGQVFDPRITT